MCRPKLHSPLVCMCQYKGVMLLYGNIRTLHNARRLEQMDIKYTLSWYWFLCWPGNIFLNSNKICVYYQVFQNFKFKNSGINIALEKTLTKVPHLTYWSIYENLGCCFYAIVPHVKGSGQCETYLRLVFPLHLSKSGVWPLLDGW